MDQFIREKLLSIQAVIFDFDGVFTNNKVIVFENGMEAVLCSRADGFGISRLRKLKMHMLILSTEVNPVVTKRAEKLKLQVIQAVDDKIKVLKDWANEINIKLDKIAYLGNDINDKECLKQVGLPVIVADAMPEVIPYATLVLRNNGGEGAVREFCDMIWFVNQK
jgi:3-deoxy-D-manno-octulosonate 8-phosphate phosphatase (KDO 8-P phosphatase)